MQHYIFVQMIITINFFFIEENLSPRRSHFFIFVGFYEIYFKRFILAMDEFENQRRITILYGILLSLRCEFLSKIVWSVLSLLQFSLLSDHVQGFGILWVDFLLLNEPLVWLLIPIQDYRIIQFKSYNIFMLSDFVIFTLLNSYAKLKEPLILILVPIQSCANLLFYY